MKFLRRFWCNRCGFWLRGGIEPSFQICIIYVLCERIILISSIICDWIWWTNIVRIITIAILIIRIMGCTYATITVWHFIVIGRIQWRISKIIWIGFPTLEIFIIICNSIHELISLVIIFQVTGIGYIVNSCIWRWGKQFDFPFSIGIGNIFILSQQKRKSSIFVSFHQLWFGICWFIGQTPSQCARNLKN